MSQTTTRILFFFLLSFISLTSAGLSKEEFIGRRLHQNNDEIEKRLASVIVTFSDHSQSYDPLFQRVPPSSPSRESRVSVYEYDARDIERLHRALTSTDDIETIRLFEGPVVTQLLHDIESVPSPGSVLFNFECSSAMEDLDQKILIPFISLLLQRGHFLMFGDFSLKGLITNWDETQLGQNIFTQLGTVQGEMKLKFSPEKLKASPSVQLRTVGELAEGGVATIQAMASTIVFGLVNKELTETELFHVEVLTKVELPRNYYSGFDISECSSEPLGHVLLTSKVTGGKLLVSAGHWLQLSSLKTTEEAILKYAERTGGFEFARKMKASWNELDESQREEELQRYSKQEIQKSAPHSYF